MNFALIGNQNCGKTTLFNQLTGANRHVGNFPGVTVDSEFGAIRGTKDAQVVDLPGIYSVRPYSDEEKITRDFLLSGSADAIINIVDATNIERNLYLTLQLIETRLPMVLALNMMDELRAGGGSVDIEGLSEALGIPVVPISAAKNEGVQELVNVAVETARRNIRPKKIDFCTDGPVHRCIHAVAHLVEDHARAAKMSPRFAATKLIENDPDIVERLAINENEKEMLEHSVREMEDERGLDRNAAMADMRYAFIEKACAANIVKCCASPEYIRSVKIDKILTNRYLAIPVFMLIMLAIFYLTFNVVGAYLSDLLAAGIDALTLIVQQLLQAYGINPVVESLIVEGVFGGVGSVLSFLPIIVVLFFFLSVLEDTGYMARIAFVMDKPLRRLGLSGRSIVPLLIGFGCSVPAIMATRTLPSDRDRKMTLLLTPYMSCSAKIPIYAVFSAAFFPKYAALAMFALYFGGIIIGILAAQALKATRFRGNPVPFVMELPNYRFPNAKSVLLLLWGKAKDFLQRAFTVIFVASLIIWFLRTFDLRFNVVSGDGAESILAAVGRLIAPVFAPLGFGDWRAATSLIAGFSAKEAVVSTMAVLLGTSVTELSGTLGTLFTPQAAASFLCFTLLYTPCVAAVATLKRELGSRGKTLLAVVLQCGVAWLAALAVYNLAMLIS